MNSKLTYGIKLIGSCAILFGSVTGCSLTPSQETINLQLIEPYESELPVIDSVYRKSVGDEVYSKDAQEDTFLP